MGGGKNEKTKVPTHCFLKRNKIDGIIDSVDMSLSKLWEMVKDRELHAAGVHGVTKSWTQLSN